MADTENKLRIFLCYSSFDRPRVRTLYDRLIKEAWIEPWMDEKKLLGGQDWKLEIAKAVEDAHKVIVFLSKESVEREGYVWRELREILDKAKEKPEGRIFVIPVRLNECTVPNSLRDWHWIDYFPSEVRNKAYDRLVQSLSPELVVHVQSSQDEIEWMNPRWWIREIRSGLRGPRVVVSMGLAAAGFMCNVCGMAYPVFCPIQAPFFGALAAHYSVMQEKDDIYSRQRGGTIGMISALFVGTAQLLATILLSICLIAYTPSVVMSSSNADYLLTLLRGLPLLVGINFFFLIITGIVGYFAGYLSTTVK